MRVKNVGKEPINYSEENQTLLDTKGREYSPDDEAWIYMDDNNPWGEINPGNSLRNDRAVRHPSQGQARSLAAQGWSVRLFGRREGGAVVWLAIWPETS
jgi:hypothetical protein